MATSYSVVAIGPEPDSLVSRKLQADVGAIIAQIESCMSVFEPESDISRFNASSTTDWFPVVQETADIIALSLEISRETSGAFDISVGHAVEMWGFGAGDPAETAPSASSNLKKIAHIDYQKLDVRHSPPAIRKSEPDIRLDLSGIAKGYAVDRVAVIFEDRGIDRYMVEIGGEIRTAGLNMDGAPWTIGIAAPAESHLDPVLHLTDAAAATSGDYRNFRISGGQRVTHIINPETGAPIHHESASVTVIDKECARADGLSTALAVLGPEKGYDLAMEKGWAVYFILRQDSEWKHRMTPAFKSHLKPDDI